MNAKIFIVSFIVMVPILMAADYLAIHFHFLEPRSFEAELTKAIIVSLFFAALMTYISKRKRKSRMTSQF